MSTKRFSIALIAAAMGCGVGVFAIFANNAAADCWLPSAEVVVLTLEEVRVDGDVVAVDDYEGPTTARLVSGPGIDQMSMEFGRDGENYAGRWDYGLNLAE